MLAFHKSRLVINFLLFEKVPQLPPCDEPARSGTMVKYQPDWCEGGTSEIWRFLRTSIST